MGNEIHNSLANMVTTIADEVAKDISGRFANMAEHHRADLNGGFRAILSELSDEEEGIDVEKIKTLVMEMRADLLDFQEGIDESNHLWTREIRKETLSKLYNTLRDFDEYAAKDMI